MRGGGGREGRKEGREETERIEEETISERDHFNTIII